MERFVRFLTVFGLILVVLAGVAVADKADKSARKTADKSSKECPLAKKAECEKAKPACMKVCDRAIKSGCSVKMAGFSCLPSSRKYEKNAELDKLMPAALKFAAKQVTRTARSIKDKTKYPDRTQSKDKNKEQYDEWRLASSRQWTAGFFPGSLWYMYEITGEKKYANWAKQFMVGLEEEKNRTDTHDLGFVMMPSYGNGYRLTKDEAYKSIIIQTAKSLTMRFSPTVGCTRSWSWGKYSGADIFPVVIDNMMNLELLFWAAKNGGSRAFYNVAVAHANQTIKEHVRENGTTYHIVIYDPKTGDVIRKEARPGYATESCWSRGQSWAIYGYTMCYRETGDPNYLETAKKLSDYWVANLPADNVPFYDFDDPAIPNVYRDSSAAAVAACGLLELSTYVKCDKTARKYYDSAVKTLTRLCMKEADGGYLAQDAKGKATSPSILKKAYKKGERGTSYADYYLLEGLLRYKCLSGS